MAGVGFELINRGLIAYVLHFKITRYSYREVEARSTDNSTVFFGVRLADVIASQKVCISLILTLSKFQRRFEDDTAALQEYLNGFKMV